MQTAKAYHLMSAQNRRDELIMAHLPLVRHIIARLALHLPAGVDVDNLASAGTLGLVEAANRFDPERGIKFETFAYARIRGAVLDELRRNCPLPQHLLEKIARVRQAYRELLPPVDRDGLVAATGLSSAEIADCLTAMRLTRMLSWENLPESADARRGGSERPESALEMAEQKQLLTEALLSLPERERLVVTLYYLENLRLKEIGEVLELSESRVSRLLSSALFDLGEYMRLKENGGTAEPAANVGGQAWTR